MIDAHAADWTTSLARGPVPAAASPIRTYGPTVGHAGIFACANTTPSQVLLVR
jgi:hypothetical protein